MLRQKLPNLLVVGSIAFKMLCAQQPSLSVAEILKREGPAVVVLETEDQQGEALSYASGVVQVTVSMFLER